MLVYVLQNFNIVKYTNWKLYSKDSLDQKLATSSQASSKLQFGAEDGDHLGVEFIPTTPPLTDSTQAPAIGLATNPRPGGS